MDPLGTFLLLSGYMSWEMVAAAPDISIALGKPTAQSDTHGNHSSNVAVDGNYDTNLDMGSCTHTVTPISWWVVDMQGIFLINTVHIYNRDILQERLDHLTLEGFTGDPYLCPTSSSLCGYNPGPSGDLVNLTCPPNIPVRYIKVFNEHSALTLCEVDVIGQPWTDCRQSTMNKQPKTKLNTTYSNLGVVRIPNDCLAKCHHRTGHCSIFNYNVVDGSCLVLAESTIPFSSSDLTTDDDWDLYYTC